MIYVLGYGALTCPDTMKRRCPSAVKVGKGRLDGYELIIRDVSSIHPKAGSSVYGAVWKIDPKDLDSLDKSEGYPWKYLRCEEDVFIGNHQIKVWVYFFTVPKVEPLLSADNEYYRICKKGYKWWGLDFAQFETAQKEAVFLEAEEDRAAEERYAYGKGYHSIFDTDRDWVRKQRKAKKKDKLGTENSDTKYGYY